MLAVPRLRLAVPRESGRVIYSGVLVILLANDAGLQLGLNFAGRVPVVAKNGLDRRFLGDYSSISPNAFFGNL